MITDPSALQKSIQDKLDFLAALAPLAGAGNQTAEEQSRQTLQALIPESAQAVALKCKAMAELFEMLGATAPSDYTKLSEDQLTGAFEFVSTVAQSLQKLEAEVERSRERFPF